MARRRKSNEKVNTSWVIRGKVYQKIEVYKSLHKLESLEHAANLLLEKATSDIQLPESK